MSPLLISDQFTQRRQYGLQEIYSLVGRTDFKQLLDHVVPIFMSNQLNYLRLYVKDNQLNLALFALGQKALEYS